MPSPVTLQSRGGLTAAHGPIWPSACFVNKVLLEHSGAWFTYVLSVVAFPGKGRVEWLRRRLWGRRKSKLPAVGSFPG